MRTLSIEISEAPGTRSASRMGSVASRRLGRRTDTKKLGRGTWRALPTDSGRDRTSSALRPSPFFSCSCCLLRAL